MKLRVGQFDYDSHYERKAQAKQPKRQTHPLLLFPLPNYVPKGTMIIIPLVFISLLVQSNGQFPPPTSDAYKCSSDRSIYPCQAYAFYRAYPEPSSYPTLRDLPSIADLFLLPRRTIAQTSNLTSNTTLLSPSQPLLIPLTCACTPSNISAQLITYEINSGDTYYSVSSFRFANLTSYPAVISANPDVIPTHLDVGQNILFPIFCQCSPSKNKFLITYSFQPNDSYSALAAEFGTDVQSLVSLNGPESRAKPFLTILIPVNKVAPPVILEYNKSPPPPPPPPLLEQASDEKNNEVVTGLAVGLGLMGLLWVALLVVVALVWLRRRRRGRRWGGGDMEKGKVGGERSVSDERLMSDISEWLDRYKVFRLDELEEATAGFDRSRLVQGSVYIGVIDSEVFAIKKTKRNACDELKILQKVI